MPGELLIRFKGFSQPNAVPAESGDSIPHILNLFGHQRRTDIDLFFIQVVYKYRLLINEQTLQNVSCLRWLILASYYFCLELATRCEYSANITAF